MSGARKKSTSTNHKESPARKQSNFSTGTSINYIAQEKIKELEHQVSDLKKRLDELRKAKNTRIIKRDKEYVSTGTPQQAVSISSVQALQDCTVHTDRIHLLESKIEESEMKRAKEEQHHQDEILKWSEKYNAEVEALKTAKQVKVPCEDPSVTAEVTKLRKQNKELLEENEELKSKTTALHLEIKDLMEMLSRKEAEWCSKEDKLKLEVKTQWGEKYQRWMAQTEQKIEELQAANNYLKTLLARQT